MNNEKLYALAGGINDDFVAETMKPKAARPRYLRYIAAAAAVLLVLGAAFGVVKAAGAKEQANLPEKYAFMSDTEVPKDAVLPPSQVGTDSAAIKPGHDDLRNLKKMYNESDVVCIVTIRDWLGENEYYSYYEATVERVYKGDPGESVVIYQKGTSQALFDDTPLFTYGDKLLLGLLRWGNMPYDNAYFCIGDETCVSYLAADEDGETYVIDAEGEYSYWTALECPEVQLTDYVKDRSLAARLLKNIGEYDSVAAERFEYWFNAYYEDPEQFEFTETMTPHVYLLADLEAFFVGLD